jgi:membrane-bound lytic murein transglycosylase F
VRDARRIAQQRGWDRNLWFDNVERAMLLKERPEVHRETRFGYARGSEPVAYVRAVRDRYRAYLGVAAPRVSAGPR